MMKHIKKFWHWYMKKITENGYLITPTGIIPVEILPLVYNTDDKERKSDKSDKHNTNQKH